jgi:Na+-exporting ATPase
MSVIFRDNQSEEGAAMVLTKEAVERVLQSCLSINLLKGEDIPVTEEIRTEILENMEALASQGLRVLAFASRPIPSM